MDNKIYHVNTRFHNKTAHMFPAAHPMRRVLTRVIVTECKLVLNKMLLLQHGKSRLYDI